MLVRIVRYTFGALLIVLVVAIVLVLTLDFGRFKNDAEVLVSNLLQRDFTIGGPLHLTIGRSIELSAIDVRLASTEWSSDQTLVGLRHIEASVNTWSLIGKGPIRLESLSLDGLRVNLEEKDSGENNWTLIESPQENSTAADAPPTDALAALPGLPLLPVNINITDAVLSYLGPGLAAPFLVVVSQAKEVILESKQAQLTLDGKINEIPVDLTLTAGTVSNLIEYSDVEFKLDAGAGDIHIKAVAEFADLLNPSRPTAIVNLSGPKIEHLTEVLGIQQITTGPLQLELEVKPAGEDMQMDLAGTLGEFTVAANGQFADLQKLQDVELHVSASGPDIGRIAGLAGIGSIPNDPFKLTGIVKRSSSIVSGEDITLSVNKTIVSLDGRFDEFPNPESATATLHIEGPDVGQFNRILGLPGKLDGPFEFQAKIAPKVGQAASVLVKADAGDITFNLDGDFTDATDFSGSKAQIRLQAANFRRIADAFEIEPAPERSIDLSAVVERVDAGVSIKDGVLVFGTDRIGFSGKVGDEPLKPGTDLRFQSKIPDIKATLTDFEMEMEHLPAGEFLAAGQVVGGKERIAVRDLKVSLAGIKADLEAELALESILSNSKINFSIKGDNLSDLVPPNDMFRAPENKFTLNGSVLLEAKTATIPNLRFRVGKNQLKADIKLGLEPVLKSVRASIDASGPDLNELSPYFNEFSVVKAVAPFELQSKIVWEDGLLEIDDFLGKVGEGRLEIDGRIQDPPEFNNTDLRLVLRIADMHNLSVIAGRELPHEPVDLTVHLLGKDNTITAKKFDGSLGKSDLSGELVFRAGEIPELNLKLVSRQLDLTPYLPPAEQADQQPVPSDTVDSKAASDSAVDSNAKSQSGGSVNQKPNLRVIPDTPIPFDKLEGFAAILDINIQELKVRHTVKDFVFGANVANGSLEIHKFELETINGGKLGGRLDLTPKHNGAEIWITLAGSELKLGLPAETEADLEALPRYDINLALLTTGGNPREMAGTLSGYLKLTSGAGKMKSGSMQVFTNDFLFELLNTINPFAKSDPDTSLKCTVILSAIEQGKLVGKPALVVQTDRLNIFADMNIDLSTENLDLTFNTIPQKGLGLSLTNLVNPYVKVGGSLGSPLLGLNPEGVIIEGGAAVATGGLSILVLGLKDRFLSDKDPCGSAVADTDEQFDALVEKYGNPPSTKE